MIKKLTKGNQQNKKYFLILILLTAFNIAAFTYLLVSGNYFIKIIVENFIMPIRGFAVLILILSGILGLIVALFPYKRLEYKKKYFRAFVLSLYFVSILFAIGLIVIIILTFLGYQK